MSAILPSTLTRKGFLRLMMGGAAGILSPRARAIPSIEAAVSSATDGLVHGLTPILRLEGTTAARIGGERKARRGAELRDLQSFEPRPMERHGSRRWRLRPVPFVRGSSFRFRIEVISGSGSVQSDLKVSQGIYRSSEEGWVNAQGWINFDKIRLAEKLHLARGVNSVALQVSGSDKDHEVHFRSLELLPPSAIAAVTADEENAPRGSSGHRLVCKDRLRSDVYLDRPDATERRDEKAVSRCRQRFRRGFLCKSCRRNGAGYVIFTVNHAHPHCPAPIHAWEEIHPGSTTRRDLIGEMADALQKRGIRFLLYIHSPVLSKLGDMLPSGYYDLTYSEEQVAEIHKNVLDEIGTRYGNKLDGYWFDSWFQTLGAYPDLPLEAIYRFGKIGNPKRIATYNFWVFPVQNPWQDYWAGRTLRSAESLSIALYPGGCGPRISGTRRAIPDAFVLAP